MDKLFLILSLILYNFAPEYYSNTYCWALFVLFILNVIYIYIRDIDNEKIGFNSLFSLAFFLVTYLYPIFIAPFFPDFQILSIPPFNYNVVSKCTAMSNVAYACYGVGYVYALNKTIEKKKQDDSAKTVIDNQKRQMPVIFTEKQMNLALCINIVLFLMFVASGGLTFFMQTYYEMADVSFSGITGFVWVFFQTFCLLITIANFRNNSLVVYAVIGMIIMLLLAVGTRTLPLNLLVPALYYYCYKNNLSMSRIFVLGVIAVSLFVIVGIIRSNGRAMDAAGGDAIAEKFRSFMDFIIPNRDLYAIYDHVDMDGITYGISSMAYILAVIPFMQSLFMSLTGIPSYRLSSEHMTSFWEFGDDPEAWGLGTNITGDVYLAFGFYGVIILFLLLGFVVSKTREMMSKQSWTGTMIYLILTSNSIFMCRGAIFYSLKNIVWSIFIIYVIRCLYKDVTYDKKEGNISIISDGSKGTE